MAAYLAGDQPDHFQESLQRILDGVRLQCASQAPGEVVVIDSSDEHSKATWVWRRRRPGDPRSSTVEPLPTAAETPPGKHHQIKDRLLAARRGPKPGKICGDILLLLHDGEHRSPREMRQELLDQGKEYSVSGMEKACEKMHALGAVALDPDGRYYVDDAS